MAIVIQSFDLPRILEAMVDGEINVEDLLLMHKDLAAFLQTYLGGQVDVVYLPNGEYALKFWSKEADSRGITEVLQRYEVTNKPQVYHSSKHPIV